MLISRRLPDAHLPANKISVLYDRLSPVYDVWGTLTEAKARRRGLEMVHVQNGEAVLEVAAGTGLILKEIARQNSRGVIKGIDISPGMLNKAQKRLEAFSNVELELASALQLPFADETFDMLVNAYMFDLLPYDQMPKAMDEFWRVIYPGGRMLLINMTEGENPSGRFYQQIYNLAPSLMGGCRGVRMSDLARLTGFDLAGREYIQQFGFPSEVILARKKGH